MKWLLLLIFAAVSYGQQTCVVDSLTDARGNLLQNAYLQISSPQFGYKGALIIASNFTYTIKNGTVNLCLTPTTQCNIEYTVRSVMGPGVPTTQSYWSIPPTGGPYTIAQVTDLNYIPPSHVYCTVGTGIISWSTLTAAQWASLTPLQWSTLTP